MISCDGGQNNGTLIAIADNDINLTAAQISSVGSVGSATWGLAQN